jgi:hypothetical protein
MLTYADVCGPTGSGDEFEEGPPLVVQLVSKDVSEKKDEDQPNIIGHLLLPVTPLSCLFY